MEAKLLSQDRIEVVNTRKKAKWSKLLNQQDKALVVANRGRVRGFYIPYEVAKSLPDEYKALFLHLLR